MTLFSILSKRRTGPTLAGIFSVALVSVLLLCGAGLTPTGTIQKGDINANGFSLTNAATVSATNLSGHLSATNLTGLGTGVPGALTNGANGAGGLAVLDANGGLT